jgi:hypothetical protein
MLPNHAARSYHRGMARERWLPCGGFDGREVSSRGRVRDCRSGDPVIIAPYPVKARRSGNAYHFVSLDGQSVNVAHLVLETFVGPRPPGMFALHRNDVGTENKTSNLYWGDRRSNWDDALRNGHSPQAHKSRCPSGHMYDRVRRVANGRVWRRCSACEADSRTRSLAKAKAAVRARRSASATAA